jgi:hypothetical protein
MAKATNRERFFILYYVWSTAMLNYEILTDSGRSLDFRFEIFDSGSVPSHWSSAV